MKPNWKIEHLHNEGIFRITVDIYVEHIPEYVYKEINKKGFKERHRRLFSMLTEREKEMLLLITENRRNKEIAESLNIAFNTVRTHRKNIMQKLKCKSRSELLEYAIFYQTK